MKVALDIRPLQNQSASRGIGMYTSHLLKHLKSIDQLEIVEINKGRLPSDIKLIHYPWFDLYYATLPLIKTLPSIVTIHDVTPLILNEFYPPGIKGKLKYFHQKISLKNTSAVITDSQTSAKDIENYLSVPKSKIHPIYLAPQENLTINPSEKQISQIKQKYQLPAKYILYVGDINRNKNIITLVRACKASDYPLIIVGKQATQTNYNHQHPETKDLVELQTKYSKDPQIKLLGFVPTEDLGIIYHQALVYCQPSHYEGFGLTVLEAMQCGCPVIASKKGSLPEIGGNAAIYTQPTIDKIAQAIKFVSNLSKAQRTRLIQDGKIQAKKYSWQKTATQVYDIYKKIID